MGDIVRQERAIVWMKIQVDEGIADMVRYLNTIPDVFTRGCCQGTIGEGGPEPYRAFVIVTWKEAATLARLQSEFDMTMEGDHWAYVHPR